MNYKILFTWVFTLNLNVLYRFWYKLPLLTNGLGKKKHIIKTYPLTWLKLHKTKKKSCFTVIQFISEIIHMWSCSIILHVCSDASPILYKGFSFSTRNIMACSEYFAISYRFPQIASTWIMLKSRNIQANQCHSYSSL